MSATWDENVEIPILKNVTFSMEPGEVYCVIGTIGSGKVYNTKGGERG